MKATVTPDAENAIADIAQRHGLSREAVLAMLYAVHTGGGTMAQFSIPELGGREFANGIVVTGARDSTMQIDLDVDGKWSGTRSAHHARFARQRNG